MTVSHLTPIPAGGPDERRVPRLVISDKTGRRVVKIAKPRFTIGRGEDADLHLTHRDVSRAHAEIIATDDGFIVVDASANGTFVNDLPMAKARLFDGDRLRFGGPANTRIVFRLGDDDPSTEHPPALAPPEFPHLANLLLGLSGLGPERVVNEVLALVLDSAIDVTGAERGFIMLANESRELEFKLGRTRGKVPLQGRKFAVSQKLPAEVFATCKPCIVADLEKQLGHEETAGLGIRYALCVPLCPVHFVEAASERSDEKPIGVLYLDSRERGGLHSGATLGALVALSAQAALAIENARLYREMHVKARTDRELEAAAEIQQALLPSGNRDGLFYRASGTSVPCRAVGGDFFDYVDLPDARVGCIVGDVAGKGPPAALLAAAALGMFGAEATYQTSAASLMTRLNRGLLRRAVEARYLTAFYGILAPDGALVFCNAGHNPPLLVSRAGIRRLTTGGCVVGLFEGATFDDGTENLEPGDFVVAYSDGITEALDAAGAEFTDERLIEAVERLRDEPPQAIVAGVISAVRLFCGEERPNDDVTAVVVRYSGRSGVGE
jgi:sigma-B regulation protein RsbU (phosphoserine phosphatase)